MAQLDEIELNLLQRGLELLQGVYEAEIDDCTNVDGYEDSEACRRAETCLSRVTELIVKLDALTPGGSEDNRRLLSCH